MREHGLEAKIEHIDGADDQSLSAAIYNYGKRNQIAGAILPCLSRKIRMGII